MDRGKLTEPLGADAERDVVDVVEVLARDDPGELTRLAVAVVPTDAVDCVRRAPPVARDLGDEAQSGSFAVGERVARLEVGERGELGRRNRGLVQGGPAVRVHAERAAGGACHLLAREHDQRFVERQLAVEL